jgi:hypothetical protein
MESSIPEALRHSTRSLRRLSNSPRVSSHTGGRGRTGCSNAPIESSILCNSAGRNHRANAAKWGERGARRRFGRRPLFVAGNLIGVEVFGGLAQLDHSPATRQLFLHLNLQVPHAAVAQWIRFHRRFSLDTQVAAPMPSSGAPFATS